MWLKQRSVLELVGVVAGAIAGVAGAIGGILALTGGGVEIVPDADASVSRIETNVRQAEFARRFPAAAAEAAPMGSPRRMGGIFLLELELHGFDGRRCELTWTAFDADVDKPLAAPAHAATIEVDRPFKHVEHPAWVPIPPRVEDLYVIFELHDGDTPCGSAVQSRTLAIE
jgi:hypothetical protein